MNDFVGYIDSEGKIFDGTFDYEGRVGPIGPQGPAGYTPVRGVDYWTEADINYVVAEATSLINGKIEEYNNNATEKLGQFNTNATNKTEAFNDNATSKTNTFNSNATSKTTDFNNNATSKTGTFNDNASSKTGTFDDNYTTKLGAFDSNASSKTSAYNENASDKVSAYNSNATSKTNAFDAHVDSEFNELTGNFYTKTQIDGFGFGTYTKPSGGIPSTDMSNDVQVSLGKADTAVQDVSGKEDLTNKVTSINGSSTDDQYPSAKLVYDQLALKHNKSDGELVKLLSSNVDTKTIAEGLYIVDAEITVTMAGSYATTMYKGEMLTAEWSDTGSVVRLYQANVVKTYYYTTVEGEASFVTVYQMEITNNKKTSLSSSSTNTQYPSAKCVYDELQAKQAEIDELYDQIPTNEVSGETINVQDSSNLPIKDFAMLGNATQDGTPNPDYPQDIHVVTGDNTLVKQNKNLFNIGIVSNYSGNSVVTAISNNTLSFNIKGSGGTFSFNTINKYFGNTTYTLTAIASKTYSRFFIRLRNFEDTGWATNSDYTITGWSYNSYYGGWYKDNASTTANVTITIPNCLYWQIGLGYSNNSVTTGNTETISNVQVELGSTASTYEPYIAPTTQLLSLGSIELAKIGDYTDRIFKDNGKWYKQTNVPKINIPSTNWYKVNNAFQTTNTITPSDMGDVSVGAYSTIYKFAYYATGITSEIKNNEFGWNANKYLTIRDDRFATKEEFMTFLSNNNVPLYYPTSTPTYTEITDTTLIAQLENVLKMHTNKNVTNAWIEPSGTNAQAGMVLVYRQDEQTLFDNMRNAIISLGGNV